MIVDDDHEFLKLSERLLKENGIGAIEAVADSREVLGRLSEERYSVILLDLNMPHISGEELLTEINYTFPDIPVIIVTANEGSEAVVSAMKGGAFDYVTKSSGTNRLITSVRKASEHFFMTVELNRLKTDYMERPEEPGARESGFITNSRKMLRIFRYIKNIAAAPVPILITGETGTGKELMADLIYEMSGFSGELVKVNVSGLDDTVFSDTLFGHTRGAFTNADSKREGLIKTAENGILFLDEIGDLETGSQVKLLRLLQDGTYYPLGSDKVMKTNTKIIAATNRDIRKLADEGEYRKDLFYRLSFHHVKIPPLRERREDIFPIAEHCLSEASQIYGVEQPEITPEALLELTKYDYPGNVRELEGILFDLTAKLRTERIDERMVREHFRNNGIEVEDEPGYDIFSGLSISYSGRFPTLKEITDYAIKTALEETEGNISQAAFILGINRQTIYRHLSRIKGEEADY